LQRGLRDQIEDRLALRLRKLRVALVVEQHVALPREERVQRVPAARVLRDVVLEELLQVRLRLLRRLVLAELRAVGGHDVPLRAARAERVREDDLYTRLDQVVPRLDVLRVAVAEDEDDDRLRDDAAVLVVCPRLVDLLRLDEARHVVQLREVDDVRRQAGGDRLALHLGGGERVGELGAAAGRGRLVRGLELREDGRRERVADHGQRRVSRRSRGDRRGDEGGKRFNGND